MGVEKELCIKGSPLKQLNSNVLCSVPGLLLTKMPVQAVADNGKSISSNAKYVTLQKYFSHPSLSKSTPHLCLVCDPANQNLMKKSQNMQVWFSKMVLAQHFCTVCC
jgi:hypothetical protein